MEKVYPQLKSDLREKYGLEFQVSLTLIDTHVHVSGADLGFQERGLYKGVGIRFAEFRFY